MGLIAYGGTHHAVVEARDLLREEGIATDYCRLRALPVSDDVISFIERHLRVYVVEQNRDAQVTSILKSTLSGALADRLVPVTHYNGTPIAAENIVRPILSWEKNPSGPGWPTGNVEHDNPPVPHDEEPRRSEPGAVPNKETSYHNSLIFRGDLPWPAKRRFKFQSNGISFTLPTVAFQGLPSTLCKGCGHNSITSYLIEACKSIGVNPYNTIKLSGIGCSSKTPAYFLQASHGFNALHGRMPSVATGALVANPKLLCIGISGDGDTANIGMGQFKHVCRRNVPIVYIIENNGCYGLTKGQFSATADLNQHLRRPTGEANDVPPFDLCTEAIVGGATFVARSFAGDKKQMVPLLKAALSTREPRSSTSSALRHLQRLRRLDQELGLGQGTRRAAARRGLRPPAAGNRGRAESRPVDPRPAPRRLVDHPQGPESRGARRHQQGLGLPAPGGEPAKERVPHRLALRRRQAA